MKSRWFYTASLTSLLYVCFFPEFAQSESSDAAYLFRIGQSYRRESECALVQTDGRYHVEHILPDKVEIFEGVLPASELQDVKQTLNSPEVLHLAQDQVTLYPTDQASFFTPNDRLTLGIYRSGSWQTLDFPNPQVLEPFKHWVKPAQRLLHDMRKAGKERLAEETYRNNCLPPAPIRLKTRGPVASSPATNPSPPSASEGEPDPAGRWISTASVVARIAKRSHGDGGRKKTCVIVYSDGRYRLEVLKQHHSWDRVVTEFYDGAISNQQVQELRSLLDIPGLRDEPERTPPEGFPLSVAEGTVVSFPQGKQIRNLLFWKPFRWQIDKKTRLPDALNNGAELLRPLNAWLKATVEDRRGSPLKNGLSTDCFPETP
jgi:hypothetical protein